MSYQAERTAIEGFFGPLWANKTPVGYDGQNFTPSDKSVKIDILNGEAFQASAGTPGTNVARYAGVVALRVFTTPGQSTHVSRKVEDDIADIFRNKQTGNIRFGLPYVSGGEQDGAWLVRTVMVPFTRDDFHA